VDLGGSLGGRTKKDEGTKISEGGQNAQKIWGKISRKERIGTRERGNKKHGSRIANTTRSLKSFGTEGRKKA